MARQLAKFTLTAVHRIAMCMFYPGFHNRLKVTVQFETEGNGQNETVSHMNRSELKL